MKRPRDLGDGSRELRDLRKQMDDRSIRENLHVAA
ncbi:MAG: hypothetical protein QOI22_420 [Verrucomicrobiota bacterium]|jgi:hypothetical protein